MNAFYLLKAVADVVQRYYPETLHRLFIVNAPGVFVTMFRVIKAWLNPRVSYFKRIQERCTHFKKRHWKRSMSWEVIIKIFY